DWSDVTMTLLLFPPSVVPVTLRLKVHEAPGASVLFASVTFELPAVAVIVPLSHAPERPFGVATTRPPGSRSVNATFVKVTDALGLEMVNASEVEPFSAMLVAPNVNLIIGAATS